jgi:PAS domain S-box-containing protein
MVKILTNCHFLDGITDVFFAVDNSWRFVYVNTKATQTFVSTKEKLNGQLLWDVLPTFVNSIFETEYRRVMTEGKPSNFEAFEPSLGIWVEARVFPHKMGISVCLRDITERRRVEGALLERSHLASLEAKISKILVQGGKLEDSLQQCSEIILNYLEILVVGIWIYTPQTEQLELQGLTFNSCFPSSLNQSETNRELFAHHYLSLEGSLIGWIAKNRQEIHDFDVSPEDFGLEISQQIAKVTDKNDLLCSLESEFLNNQTGLYLSGYPLVIESQIVGVMGLWHQEELTKTVAETLLTLGQTLAIGIDRVLAKAALLSGREALLFRLANQIRNSLDLNTILEIAVNEIRNLLRVDHCFYLWCWSSPGQTSVMVSHEARLEDETSTLIGNFPPDELTLLGEKIDQLQSIRIDDIGVDVLPFTEDNDKQEDFQKLFRDLQIKAILMIPLRTRSDHLGAITCSSEKPRHWNNQDLELLQAVVDQLAIAIDQAEAFAQSRATALAAQTQAQQLQLALQELKQAQSQLIQTEKMSSLGQMIAGIAHEINNPVNFISGNLNYTSEYVNDLLELVKLYREKETTSPEKIEEFAEEIDLNFIIEDLPKTLSSMQVGANRIRDIVLSLRNFSRLDQADMKIADLHEGIDNTLLILHSRLAAKGTSKEIKVLKKYANIPNIECYPGQLNQVFMNLLANGIDAFPEDHPAPEIVIETSLEKGEDTESNSQAIVVKIKDNGTGMSEETMKQIFDPFFTTKPVGKGTGLGLSISYQIIVEKHAGTLECKSELGKGTEFIITIPIRNISS